MLALTIRADAGKRRECYAFLFGAGAAQENIRHVVKGLPVRTLLLCLTLSFPSHCMAEVFRCGEPKGIAMWSVENHKVAPDGFAGVQPVVAVEGDEMTVFWGDTKQTNSSAAEKIWKTVVFHRTEDTISGVAMDDGPSGSASMLYTIDVKRSYLYLSTHKNSVLLNASGASTFVSKCSQFPGINRLNPHPADPQQLEWGKSAMLKGTLRSGKFTNCCVFGKETKQRYSFIRLEKPADIISRIDDEAEPAMRNVQAIQLGGEANTDFNSMKEGQQIMVSCKELWYGNTGHYALPAYCNEAKVER